MDFRMRIGLGKHVAERKDEVVQVLMIVELALIVIKRGIRALRISVQRLDVPIACLPCIPLVSLGVYSSSVHRCEEGFAIVGISFSAVDQ